MRAWQQLPWSPDLPEWAECLRAPQWLSLLLLLRLTASVCQAWVLGCRPQLHFWEFRPRLSCLTGTAAVFALLTSQLQDLNRWSRENRMFLNQALAFSILEGWEGTKNRDCWGMKMTRALGSEGSRSAMGSISS